MITIPLFLTLVLLNDYSLDLPFENHQSCIAVFGLGLFWHRILDCELETRQPGGKIDAIGV